MQEGNVLRKVFIAGRKDDGMAKGFYILAHHGKQPAFPCPTSFTVNLK